MLIDFKKIGEEGVRVARTLALGAVPADRELESVAPAQVDVVVHLEVHGVVVEGTFLTNATLSCARCLKSFEQEVGGPFTAVYRHPPEAFPEEAQVADEELDLSYLEPGQESLDLRGVIMEQVFLNLPMKPLHDPDCKGLCPHCGGDRNVTACDCEAEVIDPRLEALARLKGRMES